jgi:hypothetical protein
MNFTETEIRVIGALIEKELTTPEYYPLSLNALLNACNQKSNRNPVMNLDEEALLAALAELKNRGLVLFSSGQGQRVIKYRHDCEHYFSLDRREISLLAMLLLRGAQTIGELRLRTQRMYDFTSLEEVLEFLGKMTERDIPLVRLLPRQPGQKEQRYIHLLKDVEDNESITDIQEDIPKVNELEELRNKIEALQQELEELKTEFQNFKKELE